MAFPDDMLNQTAVYWGNPKQAGYGGRTFDAAIEIKCRWEEKAERFRDVTNREQVSRAAVYVDRVVQTDAYLFLGKLTDLTSGEQSNPQTAKDAHAIRQAGSSPSIDAKEHVRKAWL